MWKVGDQVGSYRIDAVLKSGGMGRTYIGHRVGAAGFRQQVAIKVIHPELSSDPSFVRMFIDEAKLCARITHPNVVHVEELGEIDGVYFIAMEYVHGCSLAQLVSALARRGRRLTAEVAVSIAIQAADGLHAAHETAADDGMPLGVVHRDVSPTNVLLSSSGHVKLIDFGIAKARGRAETLAGGLCGKISYMAPEQASSGPVDRRTDVYALGVVLWELLTQRRLFVADSDLAALDMVKHPHVRPPSEHEPGVTPELDRIVLDALEADPAARPPTALALKMRLAEAMPRALLVGPTEVAALLAATMGTDMDTASRRVRGPSDDVETAGRPHADAMGTTAVLETLTRTVRLPSSEVHDGESSAEPDTLTPREDEIATVPPPSIGATPRKRHSARIVAVALGAVLLLSVGAMSGLAAYGVDGVAPPRRTAATRAPRSEDDTVRRPPVVEPPSPVGVVVGGAPPIAPAPTAGLEAAAGAATRAEPVAIRDAAAAPSITTEATDALSQAGERSVGRTRNPRRPAPQARGPSSEPREPRAGGTPRSRRIDVPITSDPGI